MTDGQRAKMYRLAEHTRGRRPNPKERKELARLRRASTRGRR